MVPMLRLPVTCQTPVSSDLDVTGTALHTVATSETLPQYPTLERSVMAEQEAELEEQEQCLEDQLLQEMMERLRERQTYIRYTPPLGPLCTSSVPLQDRTVQGSGRPFYHLPRLVFDYIGHVEYILVLDYVW